MIHLYNVHNRKQKELPEVNIDVDLFQLQNSLQVDVRTFSLNLIKLLNSLIHLTI